MKKWIIDVEEDPQSGDSVITLPPDLLEDTGWQEGDKLIWIDNKDGSFTLLKEPLTSMIIEHKLNLCKNENKKS